MSSESDNSESDNSESELTPFRRCSKKLDKSQYDYFTENGFTDELIMIVMDSGWDRIDVENYILMYNHKNKKRCQFLISRGKKMFMENREMTKRKMSQKVMKIQVTGEQ